LISSANVNAVAGPGGTAKPGTKVLASRLHPATG